MNENHIIIGANGPIGNAINMALKNKGKNVIATGRTIKNQPNYVVLDALKKDEVLIATKNASHIYVTIGLEYNYKVWQRDWPIIIKNVINAAKENNSKLIFFDNYYIYGPTLQVPITEQHSKEPTSKKGKARLIIYQLLKEAMQDIDVLIVRAPDFFGPHASASIIHSAFLENMIKGKKPMFLGNDSKKHTYGYTVDLGLATVLLALENDTYNQEWHLPAYQTNSIYDILNQYNKSLNRNFKLTIISKFTHRLLCIIIPILKEVYEMRYQFETDYVSSFDKFLKRFPNFQQTKFEHAINNTVTYFSNLKK